MLQLNHKYSPTEGLGGVYIMKLTIQKKSLEKIMTAAAKAVAPKPTIATLGGIHLYAAGGKLAASGIDYNKYGLRLEADATVEIPGSVVVAKKTVDIIKSLPDGDVSLELKGNKVLIKGKKGKFELTVIQANDFPIIKPVEDASSIKVKGELLSEAVKKVSFACAKDESRPIFTGLYFDLKETGACLVGTNTHRLAKLPIQIAFGKEGSILAPVDIWQEASSLFAGKEAIKISWSKNEISFQTADTVLKGRLIEGKYPDYNKVIPAATKLSFIVDVQELLETVERVGQVSKTEEYNLIYFELSGSFLMVSAKNQELGVADETIAIQEPLCEEESFRIAFNAKYLTDGLKAIGSGKILFKANTSLSPAVIVPHESDYTYVVTPVRVA